MGGGGGDWTETARSDEGGERRGQGRGKRRAERRRAEERWWRGEELHEGSVKRVELGRFLVQVEDGRLHASMRSNDSSG